MQACHVLLPSIFIHFYLEYDFENWGDIEKGKSGWNCISLLQFHSDSSGSRWLRVGFWELCKAVVVFQNPGGSLRQWPRPRDLVALLGRGWRQPAWTPMWFLDSTIPCILTADISICAVSKPFRGAARCSGGFWLCCALVLLPACLWPLSPTHGCKS